MTRNCGTADRVFRIVVAVALAILIYFQAITDTGAIVAGIIAAYLLLSGVLGMCFFYRLAGLDTSVQEQPYSTTDDRSGL